MGNGSPPLLTFLRCGCASALAALWFAPSAFAGGSTLMSASVAVGPVQATVGVSQPSAAAVPAAPQVPATSVPAAPSTTVPVTAPSAPVVAEQALTQPRIAQALPKTASVAAPHLQAATSAETFTQAPAPVRHSVDRSEPQSRRNRGHRLSPQGAGRTARAGALPSRLPHVAAASLAPAVAATATHPDRSHPVPRNSEPPLPGRFGLGGGAASTVAAAGGMLLFALAAALGFLTFPQLARVVSPPRAGGRPYPYLLHLERPG